MTKTCGECKHLNRELAFCRACGAKWIKETDGANCKYFEKITPPTNGDKIRHGGDDALVAFKKKHKCDCCVYICNGNCTEPVDRENRCDDGLKHWLNAPAESEGEDE